jgi:RHS repeat-associated protein
VASSSGSWQGPFGAAGAFGYQTDSSGLHLLGHRYYDSSVGRFITRDPIGDGSNWYAYCGNDPGCHVDPSWLVRIIVYWTYVAGGGYHIGLLIENNVKGSNTHGKRYLFNAGPAQAFRLIGGWGHLIGRSGPESGNADEHGGDGGKKRWAGAMVLLDDQSPWAPWIFRALEIEADMSETPIMYSPVPALPGEGNSNSWATKLVEGLGLREE